MQVSTGGSLNFDWPVVYESSRRAKSSTGTTRYSCLRFSHGNIAMVGYLPLASVFDTLRTCCSSLSRLRSGPEQSSGVRNKNVLNPKRQLNSWREATPLRCVTWRTPQTWVTAHAATPARACEAVIDKFSTIVCLHGLFCPSHKRTCKHLEGETQN
jgi:hypothetical protein